MKSPLIVAIDGPAAAGKGTLGRRLAVHLGLPYLDTGSLYRAVASRTLRAGMDPADPTSAESMAQALAQEDVDRTDLREPEIDAAASAVAAIPAVRAALLGFQRRFASGRGAVMDGRDIGTVIFPKALIKLFVTADLATRARRRWMEMRARGAELSLETVQQEMQARDALDAARALAPLKPARDAVVLDTTDLGADAAFEAALQVVHQHRCKLLRGLRA